MTETSAGSPSIEPAISDRLGRAIAAIEGIDPADRYDPAVPAALVAGGLHLLCLPREAGGLGGGLVDAVAVLSALGAANGSAALGFAMHTHVVGSLYESQAWPPALRDWLGGLVRAESALLNSAATEEGSGSPARGGLPATT